MTQMRNSRIRAGRRRLGLALCVVPALLAGASLSTTTAQTVTETQPEASGPESGERSSAERAVLDALLSGETAGQDAALQYLSAGDGPKDVSDRALALLRELQDGGGVTDPAQVQALAIAISDAVESALESVPVVSVELAPNLRLSENSRGFDFGTADSPPAPGFTKITMRDSRLVTAEGRTLRRPDAGVLQDNGVFNVQRFQTGLPNGQWRVILLTDDLGANQGSGAPFGRQISLNGQIRRVTGGGSGQWLPGAVLGATGDPENVADTQGGMLLTEVTVVDGRLIIDFGDGAGTYITGIILQPAEEAPVARLSNRAREAFAARALAIAQARAAVSQALGDVLTQVATAAGPQQLAQALQADQVISQPTAQVSEN